MLDLVFLAMYFFGAIGLLTWRKRAIFLRWKRVILTARAEQLLCAGGFVVTDDF
ncbi:hypothetical protein [Pseudomonas fluorescens]|uniref:hypothetical protein n=1 Tax=Pseudomonas fluorescens TaxID=294 RepID=UPI001783DEC7|nr:hypothetical protein [Pseudomonas fluorescens]